MAQRTHFRDRLVSLIIASLGAAFLSAGSTFLLGPCAYAEVSGECEKSQLEWRAMSRDIYQNGDLQPEIQAWSSRDDQDIRRLALFLPDSLDAVIIEEVDGELGLRSMPRAAWEYENPQRASSMPPERSMAGSVHEVSDGLWLEAAGKSYFITSHQGSAGSLGVDELWQQAPLWHELHGAYEPDPSAVEAFAAEDRELEVTVAFGTWCGDSRRSVPRLLKALTEASNPKITVNLVSIERSFTEPLDFVRQEQVTNVPTIIVRSGGEELGRFVERPRSEVVEKDLAAILEDRPLPRALYFNDDDELLASGVLGLFDGEERIGEERWRLFATEDGGRRLFIHRTDSAGGTETWLRLDDSGAPAFAEVTRRGEVELSRTRLYQGDGLLESTTRGDATGIVKQSVDWPAGAVLLAPGISGVGLAWRQAGRPTERRHLSAYALAAVDSGAPGRLEKANLDWLEKSIITTAVGPLEAVAVRLENGRRSGRYWLHHEFEVPVAVELDDGRRLILESFSQDGVDVSSI